jgi:D-tagatose-1,6-bisphosphate aldolase subunit GatZ/KbaZ
MYLTEVVSAQKRGEARGITSICSAHPWVLKTAMQGQGILLIESTCNQVNQFGGYTGMNPKGFVHSIAKKNQFPIEKIILGGDHLGPSVWQTEPVVHAMNKSKDMIREYVLAGYEKIHLDCSMRLADDPEGALDPEVSTQRAVELVKVAETCNMDGRLPLLYVTGTEVPIPGGSQEYEDNVVITKVENVNQTIEMMHHEFKKQGLESAWDRVIAVVVQPGVEFGDDFVLPYDAHKVESLKKFIETQQMIYEAHSTDYQSRNALSEMVHDHFAILKVGPALTYAFREAVFSLAKMENEFVPEEQRSNIMQVVDNAMLKNPVYWNKYFKGSLEQQAYARKFSLSDRIRYYWSVPEVQAAFEVLLNNLRKNPISGDQIKTFAPAHYDRIAGQKNSITPDVLITTGIQQVLSDYKLACGELTRQ